MGIRTASTVDEDPFTTGHLRRRLYEAKTRLVEQSLCGRPESRKHAHGKFSIEYAIYLYNAKTKDARAAESSGLIVADCVLGNDPNKVARGLDILSKRALVRERATVHKARNMVANLRACDVLADFNNVSGEVAAQYRARCSNGIDVCATLLVSTIARKDI